MRGLHLGRRYTRDGDRAGACHLDSLADWTKRRGVHLVSTGQEGEEGGDGLLMALVSEWVVGGVIGLDVLYRTYRCRSRNYKS